MIHKKDGAGCIAIQKSLLSLQAEPSPMELDKRPYYYNQKHKTMSEEVKIPKTKEECFALLDEMLSKEDKETIVKTEYTFQLHFGLGMWIRNNWIYNRTEEETNDFLKQFVDDEEDLFVIHPDDCSDVIIQAYQKYLKGKA